MSLDSWSPAVALCMMVTSGLRPLHGQASDIRTSLPGQVVDVKASEFSFQAPDSIRAGLTTFRLQQVGLVVDRVRAGETGRALVADRGDNTRGMHMLWIVRLHGGKTVADLYRAAQAGERFTAWAQHMGGPGFAVPPRTTNAALDLEPGNYALVCFVGSAHDDRTRYHLLNGMFRALTVLPPIAPPSAMPRADVIARITGGGALHLSAPLHAGRMVIRVENETDTDREFKIQRVPAGLTGQQFLSQQGGGPGISVGGLASVPPGRTVVTTLDFEAGEHILGTHTSIRHATSQVIVVAEARH